MLQQAPTVWPMIGAIAAVVYPGLAVLGALLRLFVRAETDRLELKLTGNGSPIDELKTRVTRLEDGDDPQPSRVVRVS
jgi:hypothetical protein